MTALVLAIAVVSLLAALGCLALLACVGATHNRRTNLENRSQ